MNSLSYKNNQATKPVMFHTKAKPFVQAKLTVNEPGDMYEQEADAMADRVMRISSNEAVKPVTGLIGTSLQRKCAHCEEEEKRRKPVMRKTDAGNSGMFVSYSFATSFLNASKGGGSSLPQGTRSFMENAFSTDFSDVRLHTGDKASEMSKEINAKAFTYGNDIYFKEGQYNPGSDEGKQLLAHELTHVVQQNLAINKTGGIRRQPDVTEARSAGSCYTCQIPGGVGVCCSSSDMPLVPECWDMATKIIDNCPGEPSSCVTQAKCAQCQCVAEKRGERYCQCTGIV